MCILDKLIEHPEFTIIVSRIRHAAFVSGEESDHDGLKVEIDFGAYDPNDSDSRSSHTTSLNDTLLSFSTMDHTSLLGLGHLDMAGMCQLCALEDVGEVPDDILIGGAGGSGGGDHGGDDAAIGGGGGGGVEASSGDDEVGS